MTSNISHGEPATRRNVGPKGQPPSSDRLGVLCVTFGALGAAAFLWLAALSLTDFNPPDWIRILGVVWLPIGVAGSLITGVVGRHGPHRVAVTIGLALTALTLIGFVVLIAGSGS